MPLFSRLRRPASVIALFFTITLAVAAFAVGQRMLRAGQQQAVQAAATLLPKEFPLDSFVPTGIPVTLSNVVARILTSTDNKKDSPAQIKLQVSLPTGENVQTLNLVLLSFKSSGELELVKGWVRSVDFSATSNANITLDLSRRLTNGDKLVLAVERARSSSTTYQTDFSELSQAVIANVRKQGESPVPVQHASSSLPDESSADLCNNALRRAMSLMQSSEKKGDKFGITSLRCDQQDRSYTFTYGKQN